jgi:hypothetical protein
VYVDLGVKNIISFDEKVGILKTTFALGIMWNDEKLRWNMGDIGLYYQYFPKDSVWTPKMYLLNSATNDMTLGMENENDLDTIHFADGTVLHAEYGLTTTKCDADVFRYPFDKHSCNLEIFSGQSVDYMILKAVDYKYTLPTDTNKEWRITNISKKNQTTTTNPTFSRVIFTIHFKRKPTFLVLNILTPIIGLGLINPVVFVLPESSGERVSLAVTILLALVFFLNMVSDRLPQISDPISMLNITIMVQVGNSILILVLTILTIIIFEKAEKKAPIPNRICKLILILKCIRNRVHHRDSVQLESQTTEHIDDQICNKTSSNVVDNCEKEEDLNVMNDFERVYSTTWEDVGNATNQICLTVFSLSMIFNWLLFLVMMMSPST